MLTIGFSGGINNVHDVMYPHDTQLGHDSAAVLVEDGVVVAAIEQERLDRIKHSNKRSSQAIRACLDIHGVRASDVDAFAYYNDESFTDFIIRDMYLHNGKLPPMKSIRAFFRDNLSADLDVDIDSDKIHFVDHHQCHAVSALAMSTFDTGLIITLDGFGNYDSGTVYLSNDRQLQKIHSYSRSQSLGLFYDHVIKLLGYRMFDEYKVMGLAPYGNPDRFKPIFDQFYSLKPDGEYDLNFFEIPHAILEALGPGAAPRQKGEAFTQEHKDIAAALQDVLETIGLHIARHFQQHTGMRNLALAGGVAHNCSMNGKLLYEGMFDEIFVQPAAHDAGCALGAALEIDRNSRTESRQTILPHVFLGKDIGPHEEIKNEVSLWSAFADVVELTDRSKEVASLIADGAVIGWVQGRSEFGPRSLGNRSILADPRPEENKRIINAIVKKREAYRPFAPSVLEEYVAEYFEVGKAQVNFPYMTFVLRTRRSSPRLGAVTHIDGTARVQTVSKSTNMRFWELINAFREKTGVAVLLNTSFNNNAEPIIDSVQDAFACFFTTELNYLVVDNYLIARKPTWRNRFGEFTVAIPGHIYLKKAQSYAGSSTAVPVLSLVNMVTAEEQSLSQDAHALLELADGEATIDELIERSERSATRESLIAEFDALWSLRMINLRPKAAARK
ncbi:MULTISPECIES: carbamoyltransferase C-terminal domain-containing protein [Paraburkholderia]|uniref:carbamoyltransferase family protein n=1 Tax=Paraburkholderia TaxID=1822464 RepID=UPI00225543D0|nr:MULTISPECIES: carbamoyltransferase C-terminal domain-containing protein [Paraburkholderia]MCX4161792.1 nodulation protein [Paraburkholderia megapolitana]MDN7157289.1 nodulation protein [Paraburkholderia sp. CHISQ3]MDQ6494334.1 nodulation protein [Paraburkholderia megapolitana]